MAKFLVYTPAHNLRKTLKELKFHGLAIECKCNAADDDNYTIEQSLSYLIKPRIKLTVESSGDLGQSMLHVNADHIGYAIFLGLLGIALSPILLLIAVCLEFWIGGNLPLAIILGAPIPLVLSYVHDARYSKAFANLFHKFMGDIENSFRIIVVEKMSTRNNLGLASHLTVASTTLSILIAVVMSLGIAVGLALGFILAWIITYYVIYARITCPVRRYFHDLHGRLIGFHSILVMFLLYALGFGVFIYIQYGINTGYVPHDNPRELIEIITSTICSPRWNSAQILAEARSHSLNISPPPHQVLAILAFFTAVVVWLIFWRVNIHRGFRNIRTLHSTEGKTQPLAYDTQTSEPLKLNLCNLGYMVLSTIIRWIYCLLAADILFYLITSRPFITYHVGPAIEFNSALITTTGVSPSLAKSIVGAYYGLLILPGLYTMGAAGSQVLIILYRSTCLKADQMDHLPIEYRDWINELCCVLGLSKPAIRVPHNKNIPISIDAGLWKQIALLTIPADCIKAHPPNHLRALIAHEMKHLACGDARRLNFLKLASSFMLSPLQYTMMFYDYAANERRADAYAAHAIGNVDTVKKAIATEEIRVSSSWSVSSPDEKQSVRQRITALSQLRYEWGRPRWYIKIVDGLLTWRQYFGFNLYSVAYPPLKQRKQWLDQLRQEPQIDG